MHWLDTTILALLGLSAALGFWSGLLWQVARLACLSFSIAAAVWLNQPMAQWLEQQVFQGDARWCGLAAFGVIFLGMYLGLFLATRVLHRVLHGTELELVDRLLGSVLALGKSSLILSLLLVGLARADNPTTKAWLEQSQLAPAMTQGLEAVIARLPDDARQRVQQGFQGVGVFQDSSAQVIRSTMSDPPR